MLADLVRAGNSGWDQYVLTVSAYIALSAEILAILMIIAWTVMESLSLRWRPICLKQPENDSYTQRYMPLSQSQNISTFMLIESLVSLDGKSILPSGFQWVAIIGAIINCLIASFSVFYLKEKSKYYCMVVSMKELIRDIQTSDNREAAVWALSHIAVSHRNWEARSTAVVVLPYHCPIYALMAIRGALKDQEPLVRREAAVSLGKIGGKEDVVLLLDPASNDTDPYVRKAASEAIEKIGRRSGAR